MSFFLLIKELRLSVAKCKTVLHGFESHQELDTLFCLDKYFFYQLKNISCLFSSARQRCMGLNPIKS